jgi:F0F1-type ATP synthase membrane subunit b/b'
MSESQFYLQIAQWSQIVSSIVFIGALVFVWFRWLMPVFLAAQERSNLQIAQAERHRDEVKAALEALREDIDGARRDAELIEQRAAARAEHDREALLKETAQAGERTLADAARELSRARAAARLQLRDEIVARALALAREDARKLVSPSFDERFVERFPGSLEGVARG